MSRIFISAAHKSSGKTSVSIGLSAALTQMGKQVQAFKKGPDYIDPMWLAMATQRACYNLDFYTMSADEIAHKFINKSLEADISLIEGNKGLYDGLDLDGSNSNAALAKLLDTPVLLVLDTRGMTRGVAPLILGYQNFDPAIKISGVIFNQVGGDRHEGKLRAIIEHYTDIQVIGSIHRDPDLCIDERHLGLVPSNESDQALSMVNRLGDAVKSQVDLDKLINTISSHTPLDLSPEIKIKIKTGIKIELGLTTPELATADNIKVGLFRDAAFGFYYQDDLEAFQQAGATLVEIDSLQDKALPEIDALFIGGGFPETHMQQLSSNTELLESVKTAIENGLPAYAECGGLMYLSRSITWNDQTYTMAGVIDGNITMHKKPQGRGYVKLKPQANHPWLANDSLSTPDSVLNAHEFHYSSLDNIDPNSQFVYEVKRGAGITGSHDGLLIHNLLANYTHFRNTRDNPWVNRFLNFVGQHLKNG